jgi:hypothetical protein
MGRALALQGRYSEAERYLVPALRWYLENDPSDGSVPIQQERVADLFSEWGRPLPDDVRPLLEADGLP